MCTGPDEDALSRSVEEWIALLDAPRLEDAEDARWALVNLGCGGVPVVEPMVAALPRLSAPGQVEAVEGLMDLGDPAAGPGVIRLLETSTDALVRQYCAWCVAELGATDAVPALRAAYRASRARGEAPDLCEPDALRGALTDLGARTPVIPPSVQARLLEPDNRALAWVPAGTLDAVLDELAAAEQVVLGLQYWQRGRDGQFYGLPSPDVGDFEFDLDTEPWPRSVQRAREHALRSWRAAPSGTDLGREVIASVQWIDHSDL